ncbi:transcription factor 21 [Exaiptasia diaphana]|uniref:BHLH domain-containing protein n=1 Tax=Exaiptasia diaphana TaxID=2652724 RepID=A0A913XF60_EXADI|nr:transcription factor 21 [Exaiptasia diaphana]KXJ12465.1 Transcription factor 21 [Exaiptasia diaphana]
MKDLEKSDYSGEDIETESSVTSSSSDQAGELSPTSTFTEPEEEPEERPAQKKKKRRRKRMLTGVSRQRRAANERERKRIQGVNRAFVDLKNTLPVSHMDISKIDILRVAAQWIDHLTEILHQDDIARSSDGLIHENLYDEHELYKLLDNSQFSNDDDDLLEDFLHMDVDVWQNWQPSSGTGVCVHTEEPYLKNLLYDSTISSTDYLSSPLVDLANHL